MDKQFYEVARQEVYSLLEKGYIESPYNKNTVVFVDPVKVKENWTEIVGSVASNLSHGVINAALYETVISHREKIESTVIQTTKIRKSNKNSAAK